MSGASSEGLSIRPQVLQLTPQYRRLRDTILRPQLRLTESRYFWERWKARLGPDAAILIMEVRDRCNRALAAAERGLVTADAADGCTVSANELAAACGFSRVTLWRILQREDVRRFIQVEHNYVYDRRLGKKRRTLSTYRVLMEDPLTEEDEARLAELLEANGIRGAVGTVSGAPEAQIPHAAPTSYGLHGTLPGDSRPTVQFETEVVDNSPPRFQSETATGGSTLKPPNVSETISTKRLGRGGETPASPDPNGAASPPDLERGTGTRSTTRPARFGGRTVDVDIWKEYPEIAHYVEEAEALLGDTHSRGFYLKALKRLYPGHIGAWQRALGLAREQQNIRRSRGALFTRLLRTFAAESGVDL